MVFEGGSHIAQASLELPLILQPPPPNEGIRGYQALLGYLEIFIERKISLS